MSGDIIGTFVSQKVNKVRWKPEEPAANIFISGSWDDTNNSINLWKFNEDDSSNEIDKIIIHDDVTQLKFVERNTFVASTSGGDIDVYTIENNGKLELRFLKNWESAHKFLGRCRCSCTDFAYYEGNIASVGEDGKLNIIDINVCQPVTLLENADGCTLRSVSYYKKNEVVTGNSRGQMKIRDIRTALNTNPNSFMVLGPPIGCTTITHHPSQKYILLVGLEDGAIAVWDLRNATTPVTLLDAHTKSVTEISFHPDQPSHLFSSSISGQLWHWDLTKASQHQLSDVSMNSLINQTDTNGTQSEAWMGETMKNKTEVFSLVQGFPFAINSFDVYKNNLVYGCDNEAVYVIKDIFK